MKRIFLSCLLMFAGVCLSAQNVAINNDGASPDASAALDVQSTSKGMLIPRMTSAQRSAISNPAKGLLVFDNTTTSFWFYDGTAWAELISPGGSDTWNANGTDIYNNNTGNVGIGTNSPAPSALLHLNSTTKGFLPPAMSTDQMSAISGPQKGLIVYNNQQMQPYIYTQYRNTPLIVLPENRWEPIMTGPRMLAWGYCDSTNGDIINGSGNFSVTWDGYSTTNSGNNWYRFSLSGTRFDKDSMLLMIMPVGNGSWDVTVAIGEIIEGNAAMATIKFIDVSRSVAMFPENDKRRRSQFYFTLFDMRKKPFD